MTDDPDGTQMSDEAVVKIYEAYAVTGDEPAEIADEMDIDLADVHEAIAHYYRHSSDLKALRNINPD